MSIAFSEKVSFLLEFLRRVGVSDQRLRIIADTLEKRRDRRYLHYFLQVEIDKAEPENVARAIDSFALYPKWLLFNGETYKMIPSALRSEYLPELKTVVNLNKRYFVLPEYVQPLKKMLSCSVLPQMLRNLKPFAQQGVCTVNYKDFAHVDVHNSTRFANVWRLRDLGVLTHLQRGSIRKDGLYAIDINKVLEYNDVLDALGMNDEREAAREVREQGLALAAV